MMLRSALATTLAAGLLLSLPAVAADAVPVRVRIIKGSRQSPAGFDPQLEDVRKQLERLSYTRWDQVGLEMRDMSLGKEIELKLPDGGSLALTLERVQKDSVTFQVKVLARKTQSRLTISRNQRIVHQVADEKDGAAYFVTVRPWP